MNNWHIFFISHIFSWFHARNDSTCYELRGHCINAFDKFQPSASRLERKKQKTPCKPGTMERNGVCVCKLYYPAFDDCTILHLDLRECVSRMFGLELQWAWRYLSQPLHRQLRKLHQLLTVDLTVPQSLVITLFLNCLKAWARQVRRWKTSVKDPEKGLTSKHLKPVNQHPKGVRWKPRLESKDIMPNTLKLINPSNRSQV